MSYHIFANVYEPDTVTSRGIRAPNSAARNRTLGLAEALAQSGEPVEIISSGMSANPERYSVWHKACTTRYGRVKVRTNAAVGLPIIGVIAAAWIQVPVALRIISGRRRGGRTVAIFYNYSLSYWFLMLLFNLLRVNVCMDLEDATTPPPRLRAIGDVRRLNRWVAMKACGQACPAFIIPAKSFVHWLPPARPYIVCRYFSRVDPVKPWPRSQSTICVLYSGPYTPDHGRDLFLEALQRLRDRRELGAYSFHLTGRPPSAFASIARDIARDATLTFHGLLEERAYRTLLAHMDVGLALQRSSGAYAETNVPSKAYEYMASGLVPVVCSVGDFAMELRSHVALLLREDGSALADMLSDIACRRERYLEMSASNVRFARVNWSTDAQASQLLPFLSWAFDF